MKIQLMIILLLSLFACTAATERVPEYQLVTWSDLSLSPASYEGSKIKVCGWFKVDQEVCELSSENIRSDTVIWVTPVSGICLPLNMFYNPVQQWAFVKGDFYADGGFGHLGEYKLTLHSATVSLIDQSCEDIRSRH